MKKLSLALIPAGCLLLCAALRYHNAADAHRAAGEFQNFTQSMFQKEITASTLSLHYTLENPADYGITDYPVTFGDTEEISLVASASRSAQQYLQMLSEISYSDLSLQNRITYDILLLGLENEKSAETFALYREPLGPTIGVQAQLPVLLSEYAFSDKADIEEYLALIAQTDSYFSSIIKFERARSAAGLFMSDKNTDAIIAQCRSFIGSSDSKSNLLVTIFNEKVDALNFLSVKEKAQLKAENRKAVANHVIPAYELLIEGLESLKGTGQNENGLCYLPAGKAYYEYLMVSSVGSYLPIDAIERRIRKQLSDVVLAGRDLLSKYPSAASGADLTDIPTEPVEILNELQQKMSADYPAAPKTTFSVKYVHKSLEDFLSPAFYLTPPIDNPDANVIYINRAGVSSPLELYTTLAHEGYPGHLYQNISSGNYLDPVRALFSFGGYTEGWATYVEMGSYDYALPASASDEARAGVEYARLNRSVMLGLSSLLDICIHYRGYTREQTAAFLQSLGFANPDSADAIFDAIIEAPANYLKYYLGYLSFLDLRSYCEESWPDVFELKDFHKQILQIGPAPFPVLEKYLKLYYTTK